MKSSSHRLNSNRKEKKLMRASLWDNLDLSTSKASTTCRWFTGNTVHLPRVNHFSIFLLYVARESFLLDPELIVPAGNILQSRVIPANLSKGIKIAKGPCTESHSKHYLVVSVNEGLDTHGRGFHFYTKAAGREHSLGTKMRRGEVLSGAVSPHREWTPLHLFSIGIANWIPASQL